MHTSDEVRYVVVGGQYQYKVLQSIIRVEVNHLLQVNSDVGVAPVIILIFGQISAALLLPDNYGRTISRMSSTYHQSLGDETCN